MDITFRPLGDWPGEEARQRKAPQFTSTYEATLDLLWSELLHLGAKTVVIELDLKERDIRADGWPRADARTPVFPGVIVSFESRFGPLRYWTDVFETGTVWASARQSGTGSPVSRTIQGWQANLRAVALSLEALRAVDRYGVSRRGEQYTGWNALPPGFAMGAALTVDEAARRLAAQLAKAGQPVESGLLLDDRAVFDSGWRVIAKRLHPDLGGDPGEWNEAREAWELVKKHKGWE